MKNLLFVCLISVTILGCKNTEMEVEKMGKEVNLPQEETVKVVTNTEKMEKSELKKEILKEGTGEVAKKGDNLKMHYTGTLVDGTKFDSSLDRNQPFAFTLGMGQVIQGWDEGILGMKIGEKRKLTIPYQMAYGEMGMPPVIPPKSTLLFEVELLEIVK